MFDYRPLDDPRQIVPIATSAFAFRYPEQGSIDEWLASSLEDERELYGVYEDGQLLAGYMLYDYQMRVRSSVLPMGGIGLLCSRLDTRGKGSVRCMLKNSLRTMKEKGHAVSVLGPFSETFYRKYGWEKFSRIQTIELSPGILKIPGNSGADIVATDLGFPDDATMAFYNAYAASHHTLVQRGKREWDSRLRILPWSTDTAARGVVRFSSDERVVGLMEYELSRKAEEFQSTFKAHLLAAEEDSVLHEMLRYLKRLSHQVSCIRMHLPLDCDLWPYLSSPPDKWKVQDTFMIRIVSIEALDGLAIDAPDMALSIDVDDQQASWNHGIWELCVESAVLRVRRGKQADLRCGIGALSSVLSGFASFKELISARLVEPLNTYRDQDFPKTTPFLADYF